MNEIPKNVKLSKLNGKQSLWLLALVIFVGAFVYVLPKVFVKASPPTVNSSNSGVETNSGVSNKGADNRAGNVSVQGNNATVINNSSINTK